MGWVVVTPDGSGGWPLTDVEGPWMGGVFPRCSGQPGAIFYTHPGFLPHKQSQNSHCTDIIP